MLRCVFRALKESPIEYWVYFVRMYISYRLPCFSKWYQTRLMVRWQQVKPSEDLSVLSRCYVSSIPNVRVGIGHTLSEYITGRIWALKTDVSFAHCNLLEPWDSMLHFKGAAPTLRELKKKGMRTFKMPRLSNKLEELDFEATRRKWAGLAQKEPICFLLGDGQNTFEIAYPSLHLRRLYRSHPEFEARLDLRAQGKVNVSVHVRRRNQVDMLNASVHDSSSAAYKSRYLGMDYFLSLCRIVEEALGADCVQFNIFSQGEPAKFEAFKELRHVRLCLDTNPYETFHNLTLSDILITSPSSFSFKAGMLCPGLKLAKYPWWHQIPSDEEWVRVNENTHEQKRLLIQRIRKWKANIDECPV